MARQFILPVILQIVFLSFTLSVKVCDNQFDYDNPFTTNCHDDPDGDASPKDIIDRWGISTQIEHTLYTPSGYQIYIIQAVPLDASSTAAPLVFAHGIGLNMRGFLSLQNSTLAYNALLQQKRQVFLLANRGTIFSTGTNNGLTMNDYNYWKFNFEDIALEELVLAINLAKQQTGRNPIHVGFSMGNTIGFVLCSLKPDYCTQNLAGIVALAPIAYMDNYIPSAYGWLSLFWPIAQPFAKMLWNGNMMPRNPQQTKMCLTNSITMMGCYVSKAVLFGFDYDGLNWPKLPIIWTNNQDSIGENVFTHFSQNINSARFARFDYKINNVAVYGTPTNPDYEVEKIPVKVALFTGKNDALATEKNAQKLWNKLPVGSRCSFTSVNSPTFAHDGFINNKNLYTLVVQPVLTTVSQMEQGICNP
ncbi:unnamed protein product [Phyllotreta striolata]|uniref:Uncharacterized protein n=1 Tax=Phyllotreta striolata TaxID=444603 RepID=A0A9N9TPV2_PHYSR|nr:unnamed protein product [Phyllotreta striolata]